MNEKVVETPLPYLDAKEQKIVDGIKDAGGDVFRDVLKKKVGGSNTTFIRKIASLKDKGIIEEYKRRDGRTKTAYRFTAHANRLFHFAEALRLQNWFSASQKIELFPEFERMAQALMGNDFNVYEKLGIEPQHIFLETSLAASESPRMKDDEVRETLAMCNAFLQKIVTTRLHPEFGEGVEGYILFHYRLEKPKEELQRTLPQCLMSYVTATDPLERHKASSQLVELSIRYQNVLPMVTMTALNVAHSLKLISDEKALRESYRSYKDEPEFEQMNRVRVAIAALGIFRKLYEKFGAR